MLSETAYISLITQLLTGIVDLYGLSINVPLEYEKIKHLLTIELFVQIIEFIFYIWLVINIKLKKDITEYRYYDWFITTPIMLVSLMIYYDDKSITIEDFLKNNTLDIIIVLFLNLSMLLFGYLGQTNKIEYKNGGILGFISFIILFTFIYIKYVYVENKNATIYYYFLCFWSLYGVAYFQNYELKNSIYNILDLFAKNGFGLLLVWILYKNRIK